MGSAGTLSCPNCGAKVDAEANRCPYCQAQLATVACPGCFAKFFRGFSNCPYCGTEAERGPAAATNLHCPKCERKRKLVAVRIGSIAVDECGDCAGLWLEHRTFERIQTEKEEHSAILGMPVPVTASHEKAVRYCPCPVCGALMNRLNFARCSGVIVDTCKQHGTWFDADELRQIVTFIEAGGMAKARERELEQLHDEKESLKSTMRQLEYERQHDAMVHARPPSANFGPGFGEMVGAVGYLIGRFFG